MEKLFNKLKEEQYKIPFISALVIGFLTHIVMIVNKYPNVDSMTNFYFDQNMITSGRWFLVVACGISSFYDLNFVNGFLAIIFLAISSVYVTRFFDVKKKSVMILIPAIMMTFPAVAATMSYMYTVDGYMLGLLMSILAVYTAKKRKFGFIGGAFLLAFSMGTYQAYISVAILMCLFDIFLGILEKEDIFDVWNRGFKYIIMGVAGGAMYYIILRILLVIEHKELDTYQGINQMGKIPLSSIPDRMFSVFYDFGAFALRGRVFVNNIYTMIIVCVIISAAFAAIVLLFIKKEAYKKWYSYLLSILIFVLTPVGCNIMLLMSPGVEYHLLMRMQWEFFLILALVIFERVFAAYETQKDKMKFIRAVAVVLVALLCYNFFLIDNIAYFNLQQRYEKTYAYCVRLLDRIEQTDGYYTGMPVCLVGRVSKENFPSTDITFDVTGKLRGVGGVDEVFLLYKGEQYREFMKNYLGATVNIMEGDAVEDMYYSEEYSTMTSFPDKGSVKIVNGVMFIKLE